MFQDATHWDHPYKRELLGHVESRGGTSFQTRDVASTSSIDNGKSSQSSTSRPIPREVERPFGAVTLSGFRRPSFQKERPRFTRRASCRAYVTGAFDMASKK
eukprot:scaffold87098_cov43-Attheya_sp.AAC.2